MPLTANIEINFKYRFKFSTIRLSNCPFHVPLWLKKIINENSDLWTEPKESKIHLPDTRRSLGSTNERQSSHENAPLLSTCLIKLPFLRVSSTLKFLTFNKSTDRMKSINAHESHERRHTRETGRVHVESYATFVSTPAA